MRIFLLCFVLLILVLAISYASSSENSIESEQKNVLTGDDFSQENNVPRRILLFSDKYTAYDRDVPVTCQVNRELGENIYEQGTLNSGLGNVFYNQMLDMDDLLIHTQVVITDGQLYTISTTTNFLYTYYSDLKGSKLESTWYDKDGNVQQTLDQRHIARLLAGELGKLEILDGEKILCQSGEEASITEKGLHKIVSEFVSKHERLKKEIPDTDIKRAKEILCEVCPNINSQLSYGQCLVMYGCEN